MPNCARVRHVIILWAVALSLPLFVVSCSARKLELGSKFVADNEHSPMLISNATELVLGNAGEACSEGYGIFPCSTSVGGNLFLMLGYGFLLLKAAQLVSDGSDMLLSVISPGFIGGLVLPILGTSPDALLILVSGVASSQENAQSQILVGMGLLAGSTVMLLTIVWGICVLIGRCDLEEADSGKKKMKSRTLTKDFNFFETGISTDYQTRISSRMMMITVLPFVVVQLPKIFHHPVNFLFKITSCILSVLLLLGYCVYQVLSPWIQEKSIAIAKEHYHKLLTVQKAVEFSANNRLGSLLNPDGSANQHILTKLFSDADLDKDGKLTAKEVRLLFIGLGLADALNLQEAETDTIVDKWISEFDNEEKDQMLSENEFIMGMSKWIETATKWSKDREKHRKESCDRNLNYATNVAESSLQALLNNNSDAEDADDEDDNEETMPVGKVQIIFIASCKILAGATLAGIFADPLTDAIDQFSIASGIPSFVVSFVATPFATNFSEAFSCIMFARKKRRRHLSLAYSQIYGSVIMNNTLCLGIFLTVVLVRKLTWDFSSEVLVIGLVTLIMGSLSGFRVTFPLWMAGVALFLYPASIALVIFLDYVYGWQ